MSTFSKKIKFYKEKNNCEAVAFVAGGLRGVGGEVDGLRGVASLPYQIGFFIMEALSCHKMFSLIFSLKLTLKNLFWRIFFREESRTHFPFSWLTGVIEKYYPCNIAWR